MVLGILRLYCGGSGEKGFYNSQELGIAKAMHNRNLDVVIFIPDKTIKCTVEENYVSGIKVVYCPCKSIGAHSIFDWSIIKKQGVEVLQIGSDNQFFYSSVVKYCEKNGIIYYNYIGTIGSHTNNPVKKLIMRMLVRRNINIYRRSQCFVKTNKVYHELIANGIQNVSIMNVGLDKEGFDNNRYNKEQLLIQEGIPSNRRIFLCIGRIEEEKNIFELFSLMEKCSADNFFIIIGNGSLDDDFRKELSRFDGNSYRWIQSIPNSEIGRYYSMSDYFVNFCKVEIFGMCLIEAMYYGLTTFAYHAPGPDTIIENNKSGWLVNSTDEIVSILNTGNKLDAEEIKKRVMDNFTWDKTTQVAYKWISKVKGIK